MKWRSISVITLVLAVAALAGWWSQPSLQAADSGPQTPVAKVPVPAAALPPIQTFTGRVVTVDHFVTQGVPAVNAKHAGKGLLAFLGPETPIAVVVEDTSMVSRIMPGHTVYVITFDPKDGQTKAAYDAVHKLLWKEVSVSGRVYTREGLKALVVVGVHDIPVNTGTQTLSQKH